MRGERTRVPVLLVHGARTSRTMWRRQLEVLDAAGVRALAVDLPGHGSLAGERFTLDRGIEVIHDGVAGLGGRALVVGLSLGGYLGVEHRARHPEQSLGLVAASCCTSPQTRVRAAWTGLSRLLQASPDHGARLNDLLAGLMLDPEAARDVAEGGYALDAMTDVLREVGHSRTLEALAAGRSPVWLVNGRFDHFRTGERAMLAAARSSGAQASLRIVPHATHLVSLDAPVAFARVVLEAVDALSPRSRAAAPTPGRRPPALPSSGR